MPEHSFILKLCIFHRGILAYSQKTAAFDAVIVKMNVPGLAHCAELRQHVAH